MVLPQQLRYFKVKQFIIDTQLPVIMTADPNDTITIEPKLHQLLLYFCRHPNQIISRDQIINDVNHGVIVSDNAVNKMVANLRQWLNDDPKQPQFIKTIPKQGYCFIATVTAQATPTLTSPADNNVAAQPAVINPSPATTKMPLIYMVVASSMVILITLLLTLLLRPQSPSGIETNNHKIIPLTRHLGVEFSPVISPNGQFLAYTRSDPNNDVQQLWLKDLKNSGPEQLLSDLPSSSEIAWSSGSDTLIYTNYPETAPHQRECQLNQIRLINSVAQKPTLLDRCNARYIAQLFFSNDDQSLYYVARVKGLEPIQVFSYGLATKTRQLIKQPELVGEGNYFIDLAPDGQKLLILTADDSYQTTLYQLDLTTNILSAKGQWPWLLGSAIWHHDNQTIIHTSNTYSHELIHSDIWGKKLATLVSTSNRVAENYRRHPNQRDLYFTSFMMNNDNLLYPDSKTKPLSHFNSAVYDKLPTFSPTSQQWFFASKRNGITQVFSANEQDQSSIQISHFNEEFAFNTLDVSPNGQQLLIMGLKSVLIQPINGHDPDQTPKTVTLPGLVMGSGWLSDSLIAASVLINESLKLYLYDVKADALLPAEQKWQAAFASPSGQRRFYIAAVSGEIFEFDHKSGQFTPTNITIPTPFNSSGLTIKATETALVYGEQSNETQQQLTRIDLATLNREVLGKWLYMAGFDVKEQAWLVSYEQSRSGDIVMTEF